MSGADDQVCPGAKGGRRLPIDAYIDSAEVLARLADKDRLANARFYWKARFAELEERFLADGTLVNRTVTSLTRGLARGEGRSTVLLLLRDVLDLPDGDPIFRYLVRRPACLVSLDEAASTIKRGAREEDMLRAVRAVYAGEGLPEDDDEKVLGARGVRELYDSIRRYRIASAIGAGLGIPRSLVYAYWRQEGNLITSPPRSSYDHAPLVDTRPNTCRSPCVSFDGDARRDGFVLSLWKPKELEAVFEWPMTRAALLTLGGLDQIVVPLLSEQDELWVLLKAAAGRAHFLRLHNVFGAEGLAAQKAFADSLPADVIAADEENATDDVKFRAGARALFNVIAGLASLQLEVGLDDDIPAQVRAQGLAPTEARGTEKYLWTAEERLLGLLDGHPAKWSAFHDRDHFFLASPDDARDIVRVLYTGCELLESRRSMTSFLALRDRGTAPGLPPLSDFMTYLRFHLGDVLFGSYLVRVGAQLTRLPGEARFRRGTQFMLDLQGVSLPDVFTKCMKRIRDTVWRKLPSQRLARKQQSETVWRHIGLLDRLRGAATKADWLPPTPAPDPLVLDAADAASEIVTLLHRHNALPAIETFLYRTRYTTLKELAAGENGLFPSRDPVVALAPLAKAHSFVRLKADFAEAMKSEEMAD